MLWWAYTPYGEAAAVDLNRYAYFATGSGSSLGPDLFPWEYPALARMVLGSDLGLNLTGYALVYLLAMVACDLAFTIWLLRRNQRGRSHARIWLWIVAVPLLGVIPYTRYDMVVACAVAVAITWSGRRPQIAAILLSLAIALKLWPLILLPLFVMRARTGQRRRIIFAGLAPWIAIEGLGVILWGTRSFTAPWLWQQERGLQVESIAAGPLRILHSGPDPIEFRFNAWETTSPAWLMALLGLVGLILMALVLLASGRLLMSPSKSEIQADVILTAASLLLIGLLIISGKVFSPQYLLWLIAPLAGAYAFHARQDRWLICLVVAASALTTVVYPVIYHQLIAGEAFPWAVLQLRNLLLLIVVGGLALNWRESLTPPRHWASRANANSQVTNV